VDALLLSDKLELPYGVQLQRTRKIRNGKGAIQISYEVSLNWIIPFNFYGFMLRKNYLGAVKFA